MAFLARDSCSLAKEAREHNPINRALNTVDLRFTSFSSLNVVPFEELPSVSSVLTIGLGANMVRKSACCLAGGAVPFGSSQNLPRVDCLPMVEGLVRMSTSTSILYKSMI